MTARALNSIFQQWGISANQEQWNISGELCSGDAIATDTSDFDSTSGPNPYIKCVCTYSNNTHCEYPAPLIDYMELGPKLLDSTVGINALSGELPKELGNMTEMTSLRIGDLSNGSSTLAFMTNMKSLFNLSQFHARNAI
ncbi:hypothetical protein QYF36_023165 [Acer negundo]|nr:hypothetical protein QYF36_023165 [Acer negundo]